MSGTTSYRAGLSAEESVARHYAERGRPVASRRWRGTAGEIDIVARDGAALVFVEVKKSESFSAAAQRVTERQAARLMATASEYLAAAPAGQMTEIRFDVALVDARGDIRVIENALAA